MRLFAWPYFCQKLKNGSKLTQFLTHTQENKIITK